MSCGVVKHGNIFCFLYDIFFSEIHLLSFWVSDTQSIFVFIPQFFLPESAVNQFFYWHQGPIVLIFLIFLKQLWNWNRKRLPQWNLFFSTKKEMEEAWGKCNAATSPRHTHSLYCSLPVPPSSAKTGAFYKPDPLGTLDPSSPPACSASPFQQLFLLSNQTPRTWTSAAFCILWLRRRANNPPTDCMPRPVCSISITDLIWFAHRQELRNPTEKCFYFFPSSHLRKSSHSTLPPSPFTSPGKEMDRSLQGWAWASPFFSFALLLLGGVGLFITPVTLSTRFILGVFFRHVRFLALNAPHTPFNGSSQGDAPDGWSAQGTVRAAGPPGPPVGRGRDGRRPRRPGSDRPPCSVALATQRFFWGDQMAGKSLTAFSWVGN